VLSKAPYFRTRLAFVLTLLVLFFGVALFSALHQHTAGDCSLDNLEYQIVSLAEAAVVFIPTAVPLETELPQPAARPVLGHSISGRDRAPPSNS
jgi:hypothetical protein